MTATRQKYPYTEKVPQAAAGHEDEADALKAMFQATEDHWKETNAKMSTLVSRYSVSLLCIQLCLMNGFFSLPSVINLVSHL